jgi:hypothetical protein
LTLAATPLVMKPMGLTHQNSVSRFVIINVYRGVVLGTFFALLVLITDAFGIFTLISTQPAPLVTTLIFLIVSSFKFVALTIAVAMGLVACSQ